MPQLLRSNLGQQQLATSAKRDSRLRHGSVLLVTSQRHLPPLPAMCRCLSLVAQVCADRWLCRKHELLLRSPARQITSIASHIPVRSSPACLHIAKIANSATPAASLYTHLSLQPCALFHTLQTSLGVSAHVERRFEQRETACMCLCGLPQLAQPAPSSRNL